MDMENGTQGPSGHQANRRQMVIVAGMHRSGTSALTRVVNLLGADLAEDLIPAGLGNELGHWESRSAQELHEEMFAATGSSVYSPIDFPDTWFSSAEARSFQDRVVDAIVDDYGQSPLFVVKDPRIALFLPLWLAGADLLGIRASVIIPFRPPFLVAKSLEARQLKLDPYGELPISHGLALWRRYALASERHSRYRPRSFVSFDKLVSGWRAEMVRIGEQIDVVWPLLGTADGQIDAFLDRALVSARSDRSASVSSSVAEIYDSFEMAVTDPALPPERLDVVRRAMSVAQDIFGSYIQDSDRKIVHLRALLDQISRHNGEETRRLHQASGQEISLRDSKILEAATYAKSLEVRVYELSEALANVARPAPGEQGNQDAANGTDRIASRARSLADFILGILHKLGIRH